MKSTSLLVLTCLFVFACKDREAEIEKAMARYDHFIFKMEADSIANCFMVDGELGGEGMKMQVGRDSIRKFLKSFDAAGIIILSNHSITKSIFFNGDTAIQEGTYEQKASIHGDNGVYTGAFTAKWSKVERGKWLLRRMYTVPKKG